MILNEDIRKCELCGEIGLYIVIKECMVVCLECEATAFVEPK